MSGRRVSGVRLAAFAVALAGVSGACKDAQDPFVPPERPPLTGTLVQLTLSDGDDRAPAWSESGDTQETSLVSTTEPSTSIFTGTLEAGSTAPLRDHTSMLLALLGSVRPTSPIFHT